MTVLAMASSSLFGMHHQCIAPLAANSPHSGLSRAILIASSKVRLCRDRLFFGVAIQEEWGRPTGLLQSLWGTAVRILLASADSSILIRCPNSMSLLFCMIEVRRGCSVRQHKVVRFDYGSTSLAEMNLAGTTQLLVLLAVKSYHNSVLWCYCCVTGQ